MFAIIKPMLFVILILILSSCTHMEPLTKEEQNNIKNIAVAVDFGDRFNDIHYGMTIFTNEEDAEGGWNMDQGVYDTVSKVLNKKGFQTTKLYNEYEEYSEDPLGLTTKTRVSSKKLINQAKRIGADTLLIIGGSAHYNGGLKLKDGFGHFSHGITDCFYAGGYIVITDVHTQEVMSVKKAYDRNSEGFCLQNTEGWEGLGNISKSEANKIYSLILQRISEKTMDALYRAELLN